jgi:hypothetical protein
LKKEIFSSPLFGVGMFIQVKICAFEEKWLHAVEAVFNS